jgi:hypothetical protein
MTKPSDDVVDKMLDNMMLNGYDIGVEDVIQKFCIVADESGGLIG